MYNTELLAKLKYDAIKIIVIASQGRVNKEPTLHKRD